MKRRPLYIEAKIDCDLETLWKRTQDPSVHQQWDLRFSEISYLPKNNEADPQKFLYSTVIGFGIKVNGVGESVATKTKDNGERISTLKFSSHSTISIIKEGAGYWKYVPESDGIKFFTGYDYETRWGFFGKIVDRFIFRPLMIWATAWSFDCLKKWIEQGIHPRQAIKAQLTVLISSIALSLVWVYQGLVPKLLYPATGEIEILKNAGLFGGKEIMVLSLIGGAEIVFGVVILFVQRKSLHLFNIFVILLLTIGVIFSNPTLFTFPFNPFSLNLLMIIGSIIIILNLPFLPNASNCITKQIK